MSYSLGGRKGSSVQPWSCFQSIKNNNAKQELYIPASHAAEPTKAGLLRSILEALKPSSKVG